MKTTLFTVFGLFFSLSAQADARACLNSVYVELPGSGLEVYKVAAIACSGGTKADKVKACLNSIYGELPGSGLEVYKVAAIACSGKAQTGE